MRLMASSENNLNFEKQPTFIKTVAQLGQNLSRCVLKILEHIHWSELRKNQYD